MYKSFFFFFKPIFECEIWLRKPSQYKAMEWTGFLSLGGSVDIHFQTKLIGLLGSIEVLSDWSATNLMLCFFFHFSKSKASSRCQNFNLVDFRKIFSRCKLLKQSLLCLQRFPRLFLAAAGWPSSSYPSSESLFKFCAKCARSSQPLLPYLTVHSLAIG